MQLQITEDGSLPYETTQNIRDSPTIRRQRNNRLDSVLSDIVRISRFVKSLQIRPSGYQKQCGAQI